MRNQVLPRLLAAAIGLAPPLLIAAISFAQAPPPVPALPDTERRTSYSISGTTCACSVGFALYGSGSDVDSWLEVWVAGTRYLSTDPSHGWALTSATGPIATIPRPITDAVLTFTAVQTGVVQIVGAERPRRTAQFAENRGVAARDLNQALTDIIAQNRETWDKINDVTGRGFFAPPGSTGGIITSPLFGVISSVGPFTSGHLALWNGSSGTSLGDSDNLPFTGRLTAAYPPVYNLGSNTFSAGMLFNETGITVPAGKTLIDIAMRQAGGANNTYTLGVGSQVQGITVSPEALAGSTGGELNGGVLHCQSDGPTTCKGVHAEALGSGSSTGQLTGMNAAVAPVATSAVPSRAVAAIMVADPATADGIVVGVEILSTNQANNAIGSKMIFGVASTALPLPVTNSYYDAWMSSASSAGANAYQIRNNAGTVIGKWDAAANLSVASLSVGGATALTQVTGNGTNIVTDGQPTIQTDMHVPIIYGGTGTNSILALISTSGVGATDQIRFQTGSLSIRGRIFSSGAVAFGTNNDAGAPGILDVLTAYRVNNTQVVGARVTGYTAMTGTPDKATAFATSTVTLAQLAGRVMQLQADLTTHGLIGP